MWRYFLAVFQERNDMFKTKWHQGGYRWLKRYGWTLGNRETVEDRRGGLLINTAAPQWREEHVPTEATKPTLIEASKEEAHSLSDDLAVLFLP